MVQSLFDLLRVFQVFDCVGDLIVSQSQVSLVEITDASLGEHLLQLLNQSPVFILLEFCEMLGNYLSEVLFILVQVILTQVLVSEQSIVNPHLQERTRISR